MTEVALLAIHPHFKEQYDSIVREYKDAGWGIYNDYPKLDRAIAVSDAYYGDYSSIVWLYQLTGKPIMI